MYPQFLLRLSILKKYDIIPMYDWKVGMAVTEIIVVFDCSFLKGYVLFRSHLTTSISLEHYVLGSKPYILPLQGFLINVNYSMHTLMFF